MTTATTQTKHTPGPWRTEPGCYDAWEVNSDPADGGPWSAVANAAPNRLGSREVSADEAQANGHLLAAAPDLLAACQQSLRLCDANGFSRPGDKTHDLLTAAIAKAEGRQ